MFYRAYKHPQTLRIFGDGRHLVLTCYIKRIWVVIDISLWQVKGEIAPREQDSANYQLICNVKILKSQRNLSITSSYLEQCAVMCSAPSVLIYEVSTNFLAKANKENFPKSTILSKRERAAEIFR